MARQHGQLPSRAHIESEAFILDPCYSSTEIRPIRADGRTNADDEGVNDFTLCTAKNANAEEGLWVYGDGELESYRLAVLRRRAKHAKLKIYYPGKYHEPTNRAWFMTKVVSNNSFHDGWKLRSNGRLKVMSMDDCGREELIYEADPKPNNDVHHICPFGHTAAVKIEVETLGECWGEDVGTNEPPCISWCEDGRTKIAGTCDAGRSPSICWKWSSDGETWSHSEIFSNVAGASYPHLAEEPEITLSPREQVPTAKNGGKIYDFGMELFGHVIIKWESPPCPSRREYDSRDVVPPMLFVGESLDEATDENPANQEQSTALMRLDRTNLSDDTGDVNHTFISANLLAFRYVNITTNATSNAASLTVSCRATFHPVQYRGAFACSDDTITQIWMTAAYTLRVCMNDFLLDGMKRDRLPWTGDLAVSLLANSYSFADADIVARSLTVLGRAGIVEVDINGIVDYSLWWVICHYLFQRYFGDINLLRREWPRIEEAVEHLRVNRCNERGLLNVDKDKDWVFIDWVDVEKATALQVVWWWALGCGASLAKRLGKVFCVEKWESLRSKLGYTLNSLCFDEAVGLWMASPNAKGGYSRHANILAVVSGLHESSPSLRIIDELVGDNLRAVGTPYMKFFECLALVRLGTRHKGLEVMKDYWGGMLEKGATTFWEAFDPNESKQESVSFYDRPYGRSLCHAWSAGPCHFLSEAIFGIRPLLDSWTEWSCDPSLPGYMERVCVAIPTPHGCIEAQLTHEAIKVTIPGGTVMRMDGDSYGGPNTLSLRIKEGRERHGIDDHTIKEWSDKFRGWHHYPEHVIPAKPCIEGFEEIFLTDVPTVYQLPNQNVWFMSFVGFDGCGYRSFVAESKDLVTWTKTRLAMGYGKEGDFDYGGRVLGAYLYNSYDIKSPRTLKKQGGKFWSLYGCYAKQGTYEIDPGSEGVAFSEDGLQWQRASDECILSVHDEDAKDWESDSIYQPWLVQEGETYYNFYNAKRSPPWTEQIGLATSNDLIQWQRHDGNPVIRVHHGGFDESFCADGKVFRDGDHWVMFYFGVRNWTAHIMVAFSRDLVHWTTDPEPLYRAGDHPHGLDSEHAHKISLVWNPKNESYYLFYCAVGKRGRGVGLITSERLAFVDTSQHGDCSSIPAKKR